MLFIAGVIDTGDQPILSNISTNFVKKLEMGMARLVYSGALGKLIHKKPEAENLTSDSLLVKKKKAKEILLTPKVKITLIHIHTTATVKKTMPFCSLWRWIVPWRFDSSINGTASYGHVDDCILFFFFIPKKV